MLVKTLVMAFFDPVVGKERLALQCAVRLSQIFERSFCQSWIAAVVGQDEALDHFHEGAIDQFREAAETYLRLTAGLRSRQESC